MVERVRLDKAVIIFSIKEVSFQASSDSEWRDARYTLYTDPQDWNAYAHLMKLPCGSGEVILKDWVILLWLSWWHSAQLWSTMVNHLSQRPQRFCHDSEKPPQTLMALMVQ